MKVFLIALLASLACASLPVSGLIASSYAGTLSAEEETTLLFTREEEKLARDVYITLYGLWNETVFDNISMSEQRHMDTMLKQLDKFGIEDPVISDAVGVFNNSVLADLYRQLLARGESSLLEAYHVGAYIEELDIRDLVLAIEQTNEPSLEKAYGNLLAGSHNHLRAFVGNISALGVDYQAQLMEQSAVDEIVGDLEVVPSASFTINTSMNDAWFFPETSGQGFFVTVFPDQELLMLAWFTFDTERPQVGTTANLGDPGHRWLTAQGNYSGAQAELQITQTIGGIFDSDEAEISQQQDGSILLQFDDCNSGSVIYDIPSIGRSGIVPIQRIVSRPAGSCEVSAPTQGNGMQAGQG